MTRTNRLACLALIVAALWWEGAESQGCPSGWFGLNCQYECHCATPNVCDTNGICTGSCAQGWFGPACQYVDLVATNSTDTRPTWPSDCSKGQGSSTVTVVFTDVFYFTWLRLRVYKPVISLNFVVQFNGTGSSCSRNVRVSDTEVDIQCDPGVPFKSLTLSGPGVSSICSLYVSGGRNVALKQTATQTSNYNDVLGNASHAVDGNTNSEYSTGSCSHTYNDGQQTWTLTFQGQRQVSRYVIYNRNTAQDRLQGFVLKAYQANGLEAFVYKDAIGSPQSIYYITSSAPDVGVTSVGITVTNNYLALCEVEMYGDTVCTVGTYGRECEKRCNCDQNENCLVSTGGCPSGCAVGYQGEDCQSKCDATYYGKGCAQKCSPNCKNQLCDATNGNCLSCISGKQGPMCEYVCDPTFYGNGCAQSCSSNCTNHFCDAINGTCQSCIPGRQGPMCEYECDPKYYGNGCAQKCSSNCKNQLCDAISGNCLSCIPGKQGPICDKDCAATFFGDKCAQNCSSLCKAQLCDAANGTCNSCGLGVYGPKCNTVCEDKFYGENCAQSCSSNCTNQLCDAINGTCQSCIPGKIEPMCDKDCEATFYGENCAQNCSSNCTKQLCDAINGTCQSCIQGKQGPVCDKDCMDTFYGQNCSQNCSHLCKAQLCDATSGTCKSCELGVYGPKCDQDCLPTFHGENCSLKCSSQCKDQLCDANTGNCKSCGPGVSGELCDQACAATLHGESCAQNCSSNCQDQLCNSTDGICYSCAAGRTGSLCERQVSGPGSDPVPVGAIVGPIVAFIVLALLIIVGVFIWRRQHKKAVPGSESHFDEVTETSFGNSEAVSKSRVDGMNAFMPKKQKPPVKAKPDLSEGHKSGQKSVQTGTYYNHVQGLSDTSISAQDLNTFIASNTKEFYQKQFASIPASSTATITVATSPGNKHRNRYKNISAYDHSRVHLQVNSSKKHGDYINASYINGFKTQNKFIASQGPTEVILEDFVRMLWEQGTEVVVMLTNLIEEGKLKCEKYWPDDGQKAVGEITINLTTTQVFADYTIRRLELHKKAEPTQTLTHFHFTTWPDKDVPTTAWGLVDLEQRMAHITTDKPIVVHCSAGVGRTGTFIALHNVLEEIKETGSMNFFSTVQKLRSDRVFMVQTYGQYEFLHKATQIALVCKGTTVTAGDIEDRIKTLEGVSLSGPTNLEKEFRSVCLVCDDSDYASIEEESAEGMYYNSRMVTNKTKNRLYNILPKEYYRPILACASEDMSDYINAVFVPSSKSHDHQLLTQLPLPATISDLWRLVSQYKVALIVAFEKETKDVTIGDYLPEGDNVNTTSSSFNIKGRSVESDINWKVHKIVITEDAKTKDGAGNRDYCLSHVTCASTNLQPEDLLALVRKVRTMKPVGEGRILYMCRDGATFSGLVCVMSLLLDRMDYDQCVSVPLVVGAVKAIRPQVIPTLDQYRLLYQVLQLFVETNNVYSNFDSVRPTHFTAVI